MKLKCKKCGKEFESDRSNKIFCSKICYTKWQKGKYPTSLIGKRGNRPRKRIIKKCIKCGKEFEVWIGRKDISKYCSRECWEKRNPPILNQCLYCGKEFWTHKNRNRKCCSKKCDSLMRRKVFKGEKSHFWRGGKTCLNKLERTRAKYLEWRNKVFERDNYTCQGCGIKSGIGHRVYLHAHHIKPFSKFPKLRFEISNGITLCKNCHLLKHNHKF